MSNIFRLLKDIRRYLSVEGLHRREAAPVLRPKMNCPGFSVTTVTPRPVRAETV